MRRPDGRSATAMSVARPLMLVGPRYCQGTVRYGDACTIVRYVSYALRRYSASAFAGACARSPSVAAAAATVMTTESFPIRARIGRISPPMPRTTVWILSTDGRRCTWRARTATDRSDKPQTTQKTQTGFTREQPRELW